jgi:hypothetical protein
VHETLTREGSDAKHGDQGSSDDGKLIVVVEYSSAEGK